MVQLFTKSEILGRPSEH